MIFDLKKVFSATDDRLSYFVRIFLYIFVFSLPFKHVTSIREISFYLMLLLFLIKIGENGIRIKFNDLSIIAFFSLAGAVIISILFSPYPVDSLNAFRKNMFMQMAVFFVILNEFDSFEKLKPLVYVIAASFLMLCSVILVEGGVLGRFEFVTETRQHDPKTFWGGYALLATFYIPFTAGCLFINRDNRVVIGIILISMLLEIFLLSLYGKRTPLIAVMFPLFVLLLVGRKYRRVLVLFFLAFTIVGSIYFLPTIVKAKSIVMSFNDRNSMNERYAMWQGTLDMIKERPVLGYGYGWKKLSWVAKEPRFLDKWEASSRQVYDYFNRTNYGSANPHNLALQILFEIGIIGLIAFIFFWGTIYVRAIKIFLWGKSTDGKLFVTCGVLGVLMSYIIINVTNGLWEETTGVLMIVLSAMTLVTFKEQKFRA